MSNPSRQDVSNVRPLSPKAEAQILGAFAATLTAAEAAEHLAEPEPPEFPTTVEDLRWLLCSLVDSVSNVHRAILDCERKKLGVLKLPVSVEEINLSADLLTVFALELRDAVKIIPANRPKPRRVSCLFKAEAEPLRSPDMAGAMAFAAKVSVDLRDEDRDGFPAALSAEVAEDMLGVLTLDDLEAEADCYLPTPEEIWAKAAELRKQRTRPTEGRHHG